MYLHIICCKPNFFDFSTLVYLVENLMFLKILWIYHCVDEEAEKVGIIVNMCNSYCQNYWHKQKNSITRKRKATKRRCIRCLHKYLIVLVKTMCSVVIVATDPSMHSEKLELKWIILCSTSYCQKITKKMQGCLDNCTYSNERQLNYIWHRSAESRSCEATMPQP